MQKSTNSSIWQPVWLCIYSSKPKKLLFSRFENYKFVKILQKLNFEHIFRWLNFVENSKHFFELPILEMLLRILISGKIAIGVALNFKVSTKLPPPTSITRYRTALGTRVENMHRPNIWVSGCMHIIYWYRRTNFDYMRMYGFRDKYVKNYLLVEEVDLFCFFTSLGKKGKKKHFFSASKTCSRRKEEWKNFFFDNLTANGYRVKVKIGLLNDAV